MSIEEYLDSLRGRTVAVIGVGVSNQPLIELLLSHGISVTARDRKEDLGMAGERLAALGAGCGWERTIWGTFGRT